jgi:uncharacterized C2H2 Zn-finger protein
MGEVGGFKISDMSGFSLVRIKTPATVQRCPKCGRIYHPDDTPKDQPPRIVCPFDDTPFVVDVVIPPIFRLPPLPSSPVTVLVLCSDCEFKYMRNERKCPRCGAINVFFDYGAASHP